ncbi:MAG TPA: hypothetical protein DDW78_06925 [Treponema sp.]|nr:hypothetical protein [Treponema sp.]
MILDVLKNFIIRINLQNKFVLFAKFTCLLNSKGHASIVLRSFLESKHRFTSPFRYAKYIKRTFLL